MDRAVTGAADRALDLRFRVPGAALALDGATPTATAMLGATRLAIAGAARTAGQPRLVASTEKSCDGAPKGRCEAARFPVTDYRLEVAGPAARAVHVIAPSTAASPALPPCQPPPPPPPPRGSSGCRGARSAPAPAPAAVTSTVVGSSSCAAAAADNAPSHRATPRPASHPGDPPGEERVNGLGKPTARHHLAVIYP